MGFIYLTLLIFLSAPPLLCSFPLRTTSSFPFARAPAPALDVAPTRHDRVDLRDNTRAEINWSFVRNFSRRASHRTKSLKSNRVELRGRTRRWGGQRGHFPPTIVVQCVFFFIFSLVLGF